MVTVLYIIPMLVCLALAAYEKWFDKEGTSWGVVTFMAIAFIPVINLGGLFVLWSTLKRYVKECWESKRQRRRG